MTYKVPILQGLLQIELFRLSRALVLLEERRLRYFILRVLEQLGLFESWLRVAEQILALRVSFPMVIFLRNQLLLLRPLPLVDLLLEGCQFVGYALLLLICEVDQVLCFDIGINQNALLAKYIYLNSLCCQFQDLYKLLEGIVKVLIGKASWRTLGHQRLVRGQRIVLGTKLIHGANCWLQGSSVIEMTHVPRSWPLH